MFSEITNLDEFVLLINYENMTIDCNVTLLKILSKSIRVEFLLTEKFN
jgi:hypothetical protein